jgi:hypothetical protein
MYLCLISEQMCYVGSTDGIVLGLVLYIRMLSQQVHTYRQHFSAIKYLYNITFNLQASVNSVFLINIFLQNRL